MKVRALVVNQKLGDALTLARDEIAKHPNDERYLIPLSWVLSRDHKPKEALESVREAVAIDSENAHFLEVLAYRLADADHFDEAIKCARRILELEPEAIGSLYVMTAVLNKAHQFPEAYQWAQKAVAVRPLHGSYLSELAQAAYGLGRWQEAVDNWTKAIEYSPAQFSLYYSMYGEERRRNFEEARRKVNHQ